MLSDRTLKNFLQWYKKLTKKEIKGNNLVKIKEKFHVNK